MVRGELKEPTCSDVDGEFGVFALSNSQNSAIVSFRGDFSIDAK